jgi:hypothetical protein
MSARFQQGGQARDPNMRRWLCLDPGLDRADLICDRGFWSAVEDIHDLIYRFAEKSWLWLGLKVGWIRGVAWLGRENAKRNA